MATENQGWDTSTAFIRRTLTACIQAGRNSGGQKSPELYEAYRLLGTGLHTLEDLLAHSNWCEIALTKLGHSEVFCHVGDNGRVTWSYNIVNPLTYSALSQSSSTHLMAELPLLSRERLEVNYIKLLTISVADTIEGADFIYSLMGEATEYVRYQIVHYRYP